MTAPDYSNPGGPPVRILGAEWAAARGITGNDVADAARQRGPCPICGHPTYDCTPAYAAAALAVSELPSSSSEGTYQP